MIFSIASQKGGTGKTTTSISLSAGLARKGKKVLLVDIDSQANSSKVLLHHYPTIEKEQTLFHTILHRKPLSIHPTTVANLDIVPSHILLSNTDVELTTAIDHREERLKRELDKVKAYFNPGLQLMGYLFTMSDPTINTSTSLQIMRQTYTDAVIKTVIPRNTDIRDAHMNKQDIFSFNPQAKSALAYEKLINELFFPSGQPV